MSVSPITASPVAGTDPVSGGQSAGRANQRKEGLREHYGNLKAGLQAEYQEARRAAAGDPERLAEVQAHFAEQKAALKAEAESRRTELQSRIQERFGKGDDSTSEPGVAAEAVAEPGSELDLVA